MGTAVTNLTVGLPHVDIELEKLLEDCVLSPPSDAILVSFPRADHLKPDFEPLPFKRLHKQLSQ